MHSNDSDNLLKINENISLSPDENFDGIYNKWDILGSKSQRRLFRQLFVVSLVLWLAWLASSSIQQTSRRLANIAFVSLVLALSFTLILLIAIVDSIGDLAVVYRGKKRKNESVGVTEPVGSGVSPVQPVPVRTLECLNTMQLPVFLAANVFTGVINMSMKTIYVSHVNSLMVLFVYSFSVAGIAWVLMKKM
jgi:phosphatidylinositol glycan class W